MYNSNKFFASAFAKSAKKSVLGLTVMLGLNSVAYAQPNLFPTAGNAAIGTSTSAYPLHINRADNVVLNVDGTSTSWSGFYINSKNTTGQPYIAYTANSGASQAWHYLTPAGDWKLNVNSADRLTVLKSGFVGIGTIAPAYPLEVASPTAYLGRFRNSGGTDGSALLDIQNSSGKNWKLAVGGVGNGLGLTAGQFYLESTGVGTVLT
ncbi:MAG TPA: hypothetical protein VL947_02125, partial [Cytophagales bacterium]|nr:hypothetical protein [Cytophagales bacterium]